MLQAILRSPLWLPRGHSGALDTAEQPKEAAAVLPGSAPPLVHAPAGASTRDPAATQAPAVASARPQALGASPADRPIAQPIALQPRPSGIEQMDWPALRQAVASCQACGLCAGRTQTVFGAGNEQADWLVVGEAPGENEDRQGEPFVGQAGKLLDAMLAAMRVSASPGEAPAPLSRQHSVYIANVLKCRPPGNRNPEPSEMAQCEPFLQRQIELLQPKIILAMGRFAVQALLQTSEPIGKLRGRVHQYQGVPLIVTYHPAYLLRNLPDKAKAWADLCLAMATAKANSSSEPTP